MTNKSIPTLLSNDVVVSKENAQAIVNQVVTAYHNGDINEDGMFEFGYRIKALEMFVTEAKKAMELVRDAAVKRVSDGNNKFAYKDAEIMIKNGSTSVVCDGIQIYKSLKAAVKGIEETAKVAYANNMQMSYDLVIPVVNEQTGEVKEKKLQKVVIRPEDLSTKTNKPTIQFNFR